VGELSKDQLHGIGPAVMVNSRCEQQVHMDFCHQAGPAQSCAHQHSPMSSQEHQLHCVHAGTGMEGLQCKDQCAKDWKVCAGDAVAPGAKRCCEEGSRCVQKSNTYAQCLPKDEEVPDDYIGSTVQCGVCLTQPACRRGHTHHNTLGKILPKSSARRA
jgi:hypothetical protein